MMDLDKRLKNLSNEDDIKIPNSLREKVNKIYEDIESKNKKKFRKNLLKVAGVFIVLLIGTNLIKPSLAEELPIFGPVLKVLNDKWGLGIKYTENGLSVKEDFHTENLTINIESVDLRTDNLLIVYKVESKIDIDDPIMYSVNIDISGEDFVNDAGIGLDTGGPEEDGIYYGYTERKLTFKEGRDENEEVTVSIYPKSISYFKNDEDITEEIYDSREIKLTIKDKKFR